MIDGHLRLRGWAGCAVALLPCILALRWALLPLPHPFGWPDAPPLRLGALAPALGVVALGLLTDSRWAPGFEAASAARSTVVSRAVVLAVPTCGMAIAATWLHVLGGPEQLPWILAADFATGAGTLLPWAATARHRPAAVVAAAVTVGLAVAVWVPQTHGGLGDGAGIDRPPVLLAAQLGLGVLGGVGYLARGRGHRHRAVGAPPSVGRLSGIRLRRWPEFAACTAAAVPIVVFWHRVIPNPFGPPLEPPVHLGALVPLILVLGAAMLLRSRWRSGHEAACTARDRRADQLVVLTAIAGTAVAMGMLLHLAGAPTGFILRTGGHLAAGLGVLLVGSGPRHRRPAVAAALGTVVALIATGWFPATFPLLGTALGEGATAVGAGVPVGVGILGAVVFVHRGRGDAAGQRCLADAAG